MNESELKDLFVSSIESGHIFDSKNRNLPFTNPNNKMRTKSEGYFGQFDLVIAILNKENKSKNYQNSDEVMIIENEKPWLTLCPNPSSSSSPYLMVLPFHRLS